MNVFNKISKEYKFNEMDFKRIQNGQKKQPDYILNVTYNFRFSYIVY